MRRASQNDRSVKVSPKNLSILLGILLVPLLAYFSLEYFVKMHKNDSYKTNRNQDLLKLHAKYDINSDGFIDIKY